MITLLIDCAARSLVLGIALWIALAILRPRSPHVHKTVWIVALGASLAMPLLVRAAPILPLHVPTDLLELHGATRLGRVVIRPADWGGAAAAALLGLYSIVGAALTCRFAAGLVALWRLRRDAVRVDCRDTSGVLGSWPGVPDVRCTRNLSSPATFASTVLLPSGFEAWSERKLAAVLAHERAHIRERDGQVLWLARAHCCLFWFNPFAWWLLRRLTELGEATSDEAALAVLEDRAAYAAILLEFAREQSVSDLAPAMAASRLSARIEQILRGTRRCAPPKPSQRAFAALVVLPAIAAVAAPAVSTRSLAVAASASPASVPAADAPRVVGWPDDMMRYFPDRARRAGTDGSVLIAITLDRDGHATDTRILEEDPLDMGFGAAASTLAHLMRYRNPTGRQAEIDVKMKFALSRPTSETSNAGSSAVGG